MTLSNFDWTDKTSIRWFLLLASGHEGPYSLEQLIKRGDSPLTKIWAEGLSYPVTLEHALNQAEPAEEIDEDDIPPLPPLPVEENFEEVVEYEDYQESSPPPLKPIKKVKYLLPFIILGLLIIGIAVYEWSQRQETFSISRPSGMGVEIHERILRENKFESWNKKLFLKEYIPSDLSQIWLVTSSFHSCDIEARFESEENKLLTEKDQKVHFTTKGVLKNHLVTFDEFKFDEGTKIIPGLYKMSLKASDCKWTNFLSKVMNGLKSPVENYESKMSVVLYHKGAGEFNEVLDKLIRRKLEAEVKASNQEDLFWQDLQQKLQTLQAVLLQVEQLFLDFSSTPNRDYQKNLKSMVAQYTKNYGGFLTDFVIANEKYFLDLDSSGLKNLSQKRTYEKLVNMTATELGFGAMKLIEELQSKKRMSSTQMKSMNNKIKKQFADLKQMIGKKIIQVTEDRAIQESAEPQGLDQDQISP